MHSTEQNATYNYVGLLAERWLTNKFNKYINKFADSKVYNMVIEVRDCNAQIKKKRNKIMHDIMGTIFILS